MTGRNREVVRRITGRIGGERGITLVEMMVASSMAIILLAGVTTLMVSTLNNQPQLSQKAGNIQTARWVLDRLTHEIRNGQSVDNPTPSSISVRTYVRRSTCGGSGTLASSAPATLCEVIYSVSGGVLRRTEAAPGIYTGTPERLVGGLTNTNVFSWSPSTSPTYIGVTLVLPNPSGPGNLTIGDGANLRNGTVSN